MTKTLPLGQAQRGFIGRIRAIDAAASTSVLAPVELESRLIEMGFVEDARVEVLHEGMFGRDPIAVRVNNATVAIRRREAMAVIVD
ncbi:ferrous iron transport protein A [Bradyrhizobium sp. KBS0727]|jgi:ferrous iron transport protein A|uniref:FeoA family protein n=1 Tax=unclassified Bradyrhizobium TaxID=2631580 RepID=UPI00110DD10B|nr:MULTISPECIES: FeoA family protein [unclassified Bradyrhizobium]QDW35666.1 ferrous iron transport protein A [Bradyrhizobium sp. KBS0725]QDW42267.1 ferrous iron transport protein A [Bradyrhizobium sp. KBS0727]